MWWKVLKLEFLISARVTVNPSEQISTLTYLMVKDEIGCIIVVDNNKPEGIIME